MIQQCERWLIPMSDGWVASATGKRRHLSSSLVLAHCGTGVSKSRTNRIQTTEDWSEFTPCQRCVDAVIAYGEATQGMDSHERSLYRAKANYDKATRQLARLLRKDPWYG